MYQDPWLSFLFKLPRGSDGKESACDEGDLGLIPGLGRPPGEGHGSPRQCSCLESPMDRGAWRAQAMCHKELAMTEHPSTPAWVQE